MEIGDKSLFPDRLFSVQNLRVIKIKHLIRISRVSKHQRIRFRFMVMNPWRDVALFSISQTIFKSKFVDSSANYGRRLGFLFLVIEDFNVNKSMK